MHEFTYKEFLISGDPSSGVGGIRRSSSWEILWFIWGLNFSFWPLRCLQRSGMTPRGDASCLNHLCVLLFPEIVAQILLWTKAQLSLSLSQRQRIPRGDKHHLHPASCLEFRWLCPTRPLRAGCVHHLHDCDSSQQRFPSHSVSAALLQGLLSCLIHSSELLAPHENCCWWQNYLLALLPPR